MGRYARLIYSLKQQYGVPIDFYRELSQSSDILTGRTVKNRVKYTIKKGVFLDRRRDFRDPLNKILQQLTGVMTTFDAAVLLGPRDFPKDFEPNLKDYVIVNHERYEIMDIYEIEGTNPANQSYHITLREYKGSELFEIHDICYIDTLTFVQKISRVS